MMDFMGELRVLFSYPKNIILLAIRLVLAYGFTQPAILKMNNIQETVKWFTDLSIPFPMMIAYLVTGLESVGIILLIIGLFTRFISIFLSMVMLGAIFFVHLPNGFSVANNGVEIPLYYFIFFLLLITYGAGKFSLDCLFFEKGDDDE
ncbi:DoxX family protein [Sulfurovum sp. zt1-1]|uniref:DoxX family protein n=1 Tax=Sulfurovum zhangzhouensis TaxID=3019067 RepID=A0ABT7QYH8_9BACT|nr:DoxX family protein [Sulfurovum zhangzhouensis]MDM5271852.1 DoxX family protein [Sulfurovum zhangzhouensis]